MEELYCNRIKEILKKKGRVSVAWLHMASNVSAEILANAGFDVLVIDVEHSSVDYQTVFSMCQAVEGTNTVPFARAPRNDLIAVKRICDCGVMGIRIPYVRTVDEAREAVLRCKYPPLGIRGIARSPRACRFGMNKGQYMQRANDENIVTIAIEAMDGIDNLPEMMEIEALGGISIGPVDLSASMGIRGQFDNKEFKATIKRIENIVIPSGKFLGTVANDIEDAQSLYDKGYNIVYMVFDAVDLSRMAERMIVRFKEYNSKEGKVDD